ncbi:MAG TPA: HAD-IC family P-type ATPase [Candidatus Paceibacterota bacterium]|jgi:Ca2+-transporting ATPase
MQSWHALSGDDVLRELGTTEEGLTREEAAKRLLERGENRLPEAKTEGYPRLFLRQFESPLIYGLIVASIAIFIIGERTDAYIILFVLVFNSIVGMLQEGKAQDTLRALRRFAETNATVVRDGRELIIRDAEVVPGDVIVLEEGAKVPADARLLVARILHVDEASLTGESEPVMKKTETVALERATVGDRVDMVFKGTNVTGGTGRAAVVATGLETEIGKIAQKLSAIDTDVPLKASIKKLSRAIIAVVAVGGVLLFFLGLSLGHPASTMFSVVVSLAVSVIPEGLPIVMTLVLATGVWRMGRQNVLVKRLQAVEALGQARIIAVDKTGTITKNELMVERVWTADNTFTVSGAGYEPTGSILLGGAGIDAANHPELLKVGKYAAYTASAQTMYDEEEKRWRVSGDPTEAALSVFAQKVGFTKIELEHESPLVAEMPFDYRAKFHATLHAEAEGNYVSIAGAPEAVLALCTHISVAGRPEPITAAHQKDMEAGIHAMSREGLRVIALAARPTEAGNLDSRTLAGLTLFGFSGMRDAIRPEARDALLRAEAAGISVVMITGDHKLTATAIARDVGIWHEGDTVITGEEVDALGDTELAHALARVSVFARVTPEHKLRIINAYRKRGDIVAMTGDGVNDAPSLVAADLGVAMGAIGTEVAKEAADIILLDDNFGSIVSAVEEGRSIYKTIQKVILYLFSTSVGEAFTIIAALLLGMPLPLLASQIIWLNFVTDGFLVLALGLEPKERGLLGSGAAGPKRHPLIDRISLERMLLMGAVMVIGTLYLFMQYADSDMTKALTVSVTTLAIFQWFNAWNCRSETRSLFAMNPFGNLYLVGATALVAALHYLALTVPFLQEVLHTMPLTAAEWLMCIGVASTVIIAEEVRKLIRRFV